MDDDDCPDAVFMSFMHRFGTVILLGFSGFWPVFDSSAILFMIYQKPLNRRKLSERTKASYKCYKSIDLTT